MASSSAYTFGHPGELGNSRPHDTVDDEPKALRRSKCVDTSRMLKALSDEAKEARSIGVDEELNEHFDEFVRQEGGSVRQRVDYYQSFVDDKAVRDGREKTRNEHKSHERRTQ